MGFTEARLGPGAGVPTRGSAEFSEIWLGRGAGVLKREGGGRVGKGVWDRFGLTDGRSTAGIAGGTLERSGGGGGVTLRKLGRTGGGGRVGGGTDGCDVVAGGAGWL